MGIVVGWTKLSCREGWKWVVAGWMARYDWVWLLAASIHDREFRLIRELRKSQNLRSNLLRFRNVFNSLRILTLFKVLTVTSVTFLRVVWDFSTSGRDATHRQIRGIRACIDTIRIEKLFLGLFIWWYNYIFNWNSVYLHLRLKPYLLSGKELFWGDGGTWYIVRAC